MRLQVGRQNFHPDGPTGCVGKISRQLVSLCRAILWADQNTIVSAAKALPGKISSLVLPVLGSGHEQFVLGPNVVLTKILSLVPPHVNMKKLSNLNYARVE